MATPLPTTGVPTVQCPYCPKKFMCTQASAIHVGMRHPQAKKDEGERLLKLLLEPSASVTKMPWEGVGMGLVWVADFKTGRAEFGIQQRTTPIDDGFATDDEGKGEGRRGALVRKRYSYRQKAVAIERLRECQQQAAEIEEKYHMGPLQFAAQVAGVPQSNLHKWAGDEAVIVGKAAEKVTSGLLRKSAKRSWFPKAEQALYGLYMAKRRKGLKVSTLWLCTMMAQEVKKHYPDDPRRLIFKPSWRWAGKWANKRSIVKRRRSNSKNESVEQRLPKIGRFLKKLRGLMQCPPPGQRAPPAPAPAAAGGSGASAAGGNGAAAAGGSGAAAAGGGGASAAGGSGATHAYADAKFGRFPLRRRVNVDQVCAFVKSLIWLCSC